MLLCAHFVKGVVAQYHVNPVSYKTNACVLLSWGTAFATSIVVSFYMKKRNLYEHVNHGICSGFHGQFFPIFSLNTVTNNVFILFLISTQVMSIVCYVCIAKVMRRTKEESKRIKYSKQEKQFYIRTLVTIPFWVILSLAYVIFVSTTKHQFQITVFHDAFVSVHALFNNNILILQYLQNG